MEKDGAARTERLEKDGAPVYGEGDTRPGGSVCVRPSETHHQPRYGPVTSLLARVAPCKPGVTRFYVQLLDEEPLNLTVSLHASGHFPI